MFRDSPCGLRLGAPRKAALSQDLQEHVRDGVAGRGGDSVAKVMSLDRPVTTGSPVTLGASHPLPVVIRWARLFLPEERGSEKRRRD